MKLKSLLIAFAVIFWFMNTARAQTPVYFNIVSHNEITDSLQYKTNQFHYAYAKTKVKELCDSIISKQAKYNMQLDGNFIIGALNFDDAAISNDDLIEWAHNSPYIDVDGHNHFDASVNPYNYSDLAKLLDSCGVVMTRKVLGSNWGGAQQLWTQYQSPVPGFTFTDYLWQPEILWGMASPGHTDDLNVFGVWKPASPVSKLSFLQHNPNNHLTGIGGGCKDAISYTINPLTGHINLYTYEVIENIKEIADYIQTLPPGPNDFYTMNMLINFRDIPRVPNFADSISTIIEGIQDYVDEGKIVWATLAEKYDMWYAQHPNPNDFFNYSCDDIATETIEKTPVNTTLIYPNPSSGSFMIEFNGSIDCSINICNENGQVLFSKDVTDAKTLPINIDLPKGFYLIGITTNKGTHIHKLLIE